MVSDTERALPWNPEAEKAVIGGAFHSNQWPSDLAFHGFRIEWLHLPAHRTLWQELASHRERDSASVPQPLAVVAALLAAGDLERVGGAADILDIFTNAPVPTPALAAFYSATLRTAWQRREAIALASRLAKAAYTPIGEFDLDLATTVRELGALTAPGPAGKLVNGAEVLIDFTQWLQSVRDVDKPLVEQCPLTGIPDLDDKVGGLIADLWLIGADTSMGKTVLALQLVRACLRANRRALVFPLEMSAMQLVRRIVAAEARVPMSRLKDPRKLEAIDFPRISGAGSEWNARKLTICEDSDITIQEVRAIARAEHARDPLGCVLLDYIQLCTAGRFREGANREQEVSFIGAECKRMSNELGIPVIAPTQLNDEGKVRESRALKQHAAVYLVIEEGKIGCAKNRDGERDWKMAYKLVGDIQVFEP